MRETQFSLFYFLGVLFSPLNCFSFSFQTKNSHHGRATKKCRQNMHSAPLLPPLVHSIISPSRADPWAACEITAVHAGTVVLSLKIMPFWARSIGKGWAISAEEPRVRTWLLFSLLFGYFKRQGDPHLTWQVYDGQKLVECGGNWQCQALICGRRCSSMQDLGRIGWKFAFREFLGNGFREYR